MLKLAGIIRTSVVIAMVLTLASCSAQYRNHGYVPTDAELQQIIVGKDTKQTVAELVGRPSAEGVLSENEWFYVESRFRHYTYNDPKEIEREVLVISFDSSERVANIEKFGMEDGRVIALSRRVTSSSVRDTTFLRQLLGNLGNITPDQFGQTP
jgi:outer membrane protein assembly factor BamE (lipoprotein component of BamABCDE complex)